MKSLVIILLPTLAVSAVRAQSTSIIEQHKTAPEVEPTRETPMPENSPVIGTTSLIAVKEREPRKFKVNDLVTIIVRENTKYEADATTGAERKADFKSELDAFIKLTGSGIGAAALSSWKTEYRFQVDGQSGDVMPSRNERIS